MELHNIVVAFQKFLKALSPEIDSVFVGKPYDPVQDRPYQKIQIVFDVSNPTNGSSHYRQEGECFVFLCYPSRTGLGAVLSKAQQVRDALPRGFTLVENNTEINIYTTPQIDQYILAEDRIVIPVVINYFVDVFVQ